MTVYVISMKQDVSLEIKVKRYYHFIVLYDGRYTKHIMVTGKECGDVSSR